MIERLTIPSPVGPLTLEAEAGELVAIRFGGEAAAAVPTAVSVPTAPATPAAAAAPVAAAVSAAVAAPAVSAAAPAVANGAAAPPPASANDDTPPLLQEAARQLAAYFAGGRRTFDLPLRAAETPFRQRVRAALCEIPYGEVCSYGQLAARIGRPKAARAVGMANHCNPFPIVVPCHRVVGASGALTGYAGGLRIKERLLQLEGYAPYRVR